MAPNLNRLAKVSEEDLSDAPKGKWLEAITTPLNQQLSSSKTLMDKGVTFTQNVDCEDKEFSVQVPDPWMLLTPINSWTTNGVPLRIMKHPDGSVELQGDLNAGASTTVLAAGTIPAAFRPQYNMRYVSARAGGYATFTVFADGSLTQTTGTDGSFNCRYMASDATPYSSSSFPVFVSTKYTKKPISVSIVSIEDITGTNPRELGCVMMADWDYISVQGTPTVRIKNICGLPYNRKYKFRILIVGE